MSTIVSGYINQIAEQSSESKRYIYRGQSKIYDGITSTAKRRFKHSDLTPNEDEYFEYHTNLIKDARSYRYGQESELNDTELLIDLQHYGAATGLIDFSEDLLIALWFACDKPDENGEVFFLDVWTEQFKHLVSGGDLFKEKDKTKPPHYYLHTNFKSNARISAQKGVFIFGYQDIDIDNVASITIKKEDKVFIRQELKQYFNIEEKTLFQDIYGFAQVNNTKHKLSIKTESDYFQEAYEEDNAEQAIVLYQKAIGIKPDDAAYYNMGNAYGELGEYQKAINAYQKAIEIKLDMHEAYNNMGNAYNELKKYQKAINACQKAIEIKPDNHEAYNNMGNAYNGLKEYQKAINVYQKAIEIKPNDMAYYNMGVVYKELKEYQKAINAYQKAIEIKPNDVAYNNMGDAYDELKEYQKAINAYQKGIEIKPNDVAYNNMGNAYGELKEYQKAINAYQKAIEIKPDKHEAYYNMGNAYGKLGEYQKAINAYKKAIEIKPDMHEAYYNMGNAYGKLGEYQKEINAYQKAIEIKPDDNEAYNNMGVAYNKLKEYQKAINAYQKAIEIKPDNHGAYYNMGNAYGELKEYQKAINAYQKASAIFPSLIDYAKKQNFDLLESYINNLDDSPVKQQNLFILNQLKGYG